MLFCDKRKLRGFRSWAAIAPDPACSSCPGSMYTCVGTSGQVTCWATWSLQRHVYQKGWVPPVCDGRWPCVCVPGSPPLKALPQEGFVPRTLRHRLCKQHVPFTIGNWSIPVSVISASLLFVSSDLRWMETGCIAPHTQGNGGVSKWRNPKHDLSLTTYQARTRVIQTCIKQPKC